MARLSAHRSARWAVAVLLLLVVAAVIGPFVLHRAGDQLDIINLKNRPPSWQHWFGTDEYSREVLSRVVNGAQISLSIAAIAALMSMTIGTAYGMIAGYAGGRVDTIMMRILDGCLSIPRVLLLIAILALWRPGLPGLVILLGVTGWFGLSRLVRAETMTASRHTYVEAARALGASDSRILWRHILPNVSAPIVVNTTLSVGNVIALEAGLSYLGVGTREPAASWGAMFMDGVDYYSGNWWVVLFPGAAMVITVLAFNVLGDALRDVLDPRQLHHGRATLPTPMTGAHMAEAEPIQNG
jgi:peptide/nickel transport system permease protein